MLMASAASRSDSLLTTAVRHLSPPPCAADDQEGSSSSSGTAAASSGKKRRLQLPADQLQPSKPQETEEPSLTSILLTTSPGAGASSAAASSSRLLSSVAMDLAHSIALSRLCSRTSSACSGATAAAGSRCRGCRGVQNGDGTGSGSGGKLSGDDVPSSQTSNSATGTSMGGDDGDGDGIAGGLAGGDGTAHTHANANDDDLDRPCRCVEVVYLRHESRRRSPSLSDDDDEDGEEDMEEDIMFPLRCRNIMDAGNAFNQNHDQGEGGDCREEEEDEINHWDELALSKIQIRYVGNGADLVEYLASVHLLPDWEQPLGGIVVEDIVRFVPGAGGMVVAAVPTAAAATGSGTPMATAPYTPAGSKTPSSTGGGNSGHVGIDAAIALAQVVSLLAYTADHLHQKRMKILAKLTSDDTANEADKQAIAKAGFTLLVTMGGDQHSHLPSHTKSLLQNFLPVTGTLRSRKAEEEDGDGVWTLDLKRDGYHFPIVPPFGPTECRGVVECDVGYDEESSPDGMPEILWKDTKTV